MTLRIKAYIYDDRFEPRMQSNITARAKAAFRERGFLEGWKGLPPPSSDRVRQLGLHSLTETDEDLP